MDLVHQCYDLVVNTGSKNCNGEICENLDTLSCNEFDDVDCCESESEVEEDNIIIIVDDFMEFDMPWIVQEIIE